MAVKIDQELLYRLLNTVNALAGKRVLVGIPGDTKARDPIPGEPTPPTNASIGFAMEFGVPAQNIPARPFLRPGVVNARPAIITQLKKGAMNAVKVHDHTKSGQDIATDALTAAGIVTVNAIQAKIKAGPFVPLAPMTIEKRATRTQNRRKGAIEELRIRKLLGANDTVAARLAAGLQLTGDLVKPLLDTGQLRRAIQFLVVNKK